MCGRFVLFADSEFYPRFHLKQAVRIDPRYNISPSQDSWIILKQDSQVKVLPMRWGFEIRSKNTNSQNKLIFNVRVETIDTKYLFKKAFASQRCIVPANGYFEWKKDGDKKVPYYFFSKQDKYLSFAGIYNQFRDNENRLRDQFCILTTQAQENISSIHQRMPLVLKQEQESQWLDNDKVVNHSDFETYSNLKFHEVDPKVNNARNDCEDLIKSSL